MFSTGTSSIFSLMLHPQKWEAVKALSNKSVISRPLRSALPQVPEARREQKVKAQDCCEKEDAQSRVQRGMNHVYRAETWLWFFIFLLPAVECLSNVTKCWGTQRGHGWHFSAQDDFLRAAELRPNICHWRHSSGVSWQLWTTASSVITSDWALKTSETLEVLESSTDALFIISLKALRTYFFHVVWLTQNFLPQFLFSFIFVFLSLLFWLIWSEQFHL